MPDFKQVMADEIRRLARKEIKVSLAKLQETVSSQRKTINELEKRVSLLEKQKAVSFGKVEEQNPAAAAEQTAAKTVKRRVSANAITRLRRKLHLTQVNFAKILGINSFTVCNWEAGKSAPRDKFKEIISELRAMGRREFKQKYGELTLKTPRVRRRSGDKSPEQPSDAASEKQD